MLPKIDLHSLTFGQPFYLWLLVPSSALLLMGCWRIVRRSLSIRRSVGERVLPVAERYAWAGGLGFWVCLVCAASLGIVALAQPQARISITDVSRADFVILQDGSASMYTRDVAPDRWRRSVRFLRTFAETLAWKGDRVALALFAHLASPQVRLTKDPNALFFFLDHLSEHSPFRLEDDPTWDTNIEEGLYWGLNLIQKDEELFGKSTNAKAFVVISDGQAWSGSVANALANTRQRRVPVYVVGVGTPSGAFIPAPVDVETGTPSPPIRAALDRNSLREIARSGGGEYFELDRRSDREIASRIISSIKRSAGLGELVESHEDLYWPFLFAAAIFLGLGTLLLRDPAELSWHAIAIVVALVCLASVAR